jgi:hypothetical protein
VHDEVKNAPDGDLQQSMTYLKAVVLEGPCACTRRATLSCHTTCGATGRSAATSCLRPWRFVDGGEGREVDITGTKEIKRKHRLHVGDQKT